MTMAMAATIHVTSGGVPLGGDRANTAATIARMTSAPAAIAIVRMRLRLDAGVCGAPLPCCVTAKILALEPASCAEAIEPLVEPLMEPLTRVASGFALEAPRIPYLSNVTGSWMGEEQAKSPSYWATHLRSTVRFADCLKEVARKPGAIFQQLIGLGG